MAKKNHTETACEVDLEQIIADMSSADEAVRLKAVRTVCPCRMGWDGFQRCMEIVQRLQKDPSPAVRRAAMHVFEDAYEMDSSGLQTSRRQVTNEVVATRWRTRWASDEEPEPSPHWNKNGRGGSNRAAEDEVDAEARERERERARRRKRGMTGSFGRG